MGPCGCCWGYGRTYIFEMGDEGVCVGDELCRNCGGTGIEPLPLVLVMDWDAPLADWEVAMDRAYGAQYPNEWDI